jgi:uncharacterized protein (DUF736 family)
MATLATLTQKADGTLEGQLETLSVTAQIALVKNAHKVKDNEPGCRIVRRKNGFELDAGWNRVSKNSGAEYISISLSAPEFGTISGSVAPAPVDDSTKKVIMEANAPNSALEPP